MTSKRLSRCSLEYSEGWDDEKFTEIEALILGIEYATLSSTEHSASVELIIRWLA